MGLPTAQAFPSSVPLWRLLITRGMALEAEFLSTKVGEHLTSCTGPAGP